MSRVPVSVVMPVRDGALFIGEALQSIFAQTWTPQEVIVVDDGSTDATPAEVARFPDAICLRQPPLGVAEAKNHGVRRASMPHLAFLDADDIWVPSKTQLQLGFLAENPQVAIVSGQMVNFRRTAVGEMIPLSSPRSANLPGLLLMCRETFWRVGPFSSEAHLSENIEWWARAADFGLRAESIPAVVLLRRIHGGNLGLSVERPMQHYLRTLRGIVKRRRAQR